MGILDHAKNIPFFVYIDVKMKIYDTADLGPALCELRLRAKL